MSLLRGVAFWAPIKKGKDRSYFCFSSISTTAARSNSQVASFLHSHWQKFSSFGRLGSVQGHTQVPVFLPRSNLQISAFEQSLRLRQDQVQSWSWHMVFSLPPKKSNFVGQADRARAKKTTRKKLGRAELRIASSRP